MEKLQFWEEGALPVWDLPSKIEIESLLNQKYVSFLQEEFFLVEASKARTQCQIRVTLTKRDGSVVYPIECVYPYEGGEDPQETTFLMLDWLDLYWQDYFACERSVFVTIDWMSVLFEEKNFYVRGFVRNMELERQAELLFQERGKGEVDFYPISSNV